MIQDDLEEIQNKEKLKLSLSLLQATLDSTADGILVVDKDGKISSFNKQFKSIFKLPQYILELGDDKRAIEYVINQLNEPDQFTSKVHYLYNNPEIESFDVIELKDGRIIERFSCPQYLDSKPIGRVWSFRDITIAKKAEEQLNLMAHALKSINELISVTDTNNEILFVNEAFQNTYGYTEKELIGQNISIVRSPNNDPEVVNKILGSTADSGWVGEILNRKKDGTEFPISLSTTIIKNEHGEILGMVGVANDITERKQSEKALRESEKRIRLLIETQGEGVGLVDIDENFTFVNPAAEVIFGVESGKLIGRNLKEFIVADHLEYLLIESEKRSKNEQSTYEIDILLTDKTIKNLLVTATPQKNDEGKFIGTFGVFRDITDRKKSEESLRQSEMKYRTLIETMPDGVYRSTPEGKFIDINPAMIKMLGYDCKEELMAIDIKKQLYFDPVDRESLVLQEKLEEMGIFRLKKKDGSGVWVEDHGWYLTDETGKVTFHEGIMRDITDRKEYETKLKEYSEELKELNSTKNKLFSIIGHDLKSPFNGIIGLSEIIKNDAKHLDIATIQQYAEVIYSTSHQTLRLLENLLEWARIQQSQMIFRPVRILLKVIVDEVIELLNENAISKNIVLTNSISDQLIVLADQDMLKTILRNLVSNALKFTFTNGKIQIQAKSLIDKIEITVKDTGTGINKDDLEKLFKIGSNYSHRGTENESGTGLGLILCKEFIEKHGGSIWVESEVGKGSTFKFILPNKV